MTRKEKLTFQTIKTITISLIMMQFQNFSPIVCVIGNSNHFYEDERCNRKPRYHAEMYLADYKGKWKIPLIDKLGIFTYSDSKN